MPALIAIAFHAAATSAVAVAAAAAAVAAVYTTSGSLEISDGDKKRINIINTSPAVIGE